MFNWHKKEAPFFTGIARGAGGFGFGGARAGASGPSVPGIITFYMWGAGGGGRTDGGSADPSVGGGAGGYVEATSTSISSSDTLYVYVGSPGMSNSPESSSLTPHVFGGGSSNYGLYSGSGGGAAYVYLNGSQGVGTLLSVAGAGGGISYTGAGNGGGPTGGTGGAYEGATGGGGGTQVAGGAGGSPDYGGSNGTSGSFLQGGNGAPGNSTPGGGGGGGYYGGGGGGGANSNSGGDGGGGSSYINPTYMTTVTNTQGNYKNVTNPSPYVDPNWHSYGAYKPVSADTRNIPGSPSKYGGRARVVVSNGVWYRTFNFQGAVESIPANYSPYGLDFTVSGSSPVDGPYDFGWGWGKSGCPGATICSIANSGSISYTFNFSGPNSDFTNFEVWTCNGNGLSNFTGQFNGGSPFSFPTTSPNGGGTPSGNLSPHIPSGNITSFTITHGGGSGNSHLFVNAMKINGITVDFGRNLM
jgi:hypothetical protein